MKILIYGADVIGSIFAAKLSLSGKDVTVLARGKRLEEINREGIVICNPKTKDKEIAEVKAVDKMFMKIIKKSKVKTPHIDSLKQNLLCAK